MSTRSTQPSHAGTRGRLNNRPAVEISRLPSWLFPPAQWQHLDQFGYQALPAINSQVTLVSFTVPIGYNGFINKIANEYVGAGFTPGSGELMWQILVDGTTPPGPNDYNNIGASLGAVDLPTKISGFRLFETQTIEILCTNVSLAVAGTQLVGARLMGYLLPVTELDEDVSF